MLPLDKKMSSKKSRIFSTKRYKFQPPLVKDNLNGGTRKIFKENIFKKYFFTEDIV